MIKKLKWIIVLIVVLYTVGALYIPAAVDPLAEKIGISGYNSFIKSFKGNLDQVSTDIPTTDELIEGGKAAYSGAVDLKDTVVDGISTTKDTIDTVRSTLSGAESTYNDAKETFDQAKDFVEGANEKLQDVKGTLDDVTELGASITNLVDTDTVDTATKENNK